MGVGENSRIQYSPGVPTALAPNSNPLLSIGGGSPFGTNTQLPEARESEIYGDTQWVNTLTTPYAGKIASAFTGSVIYAQAGDWIFCVEQNAGDEPSFVSSNDCRGSYAKILTLQGAGGETSNQLVDVDITLDRPLSGLPVAGDNCRVIKSGNVFSTVTETQARNGLVDHSELWYWNTDGNAEDIQFWVEPIQANDCTIEIMRPGDLRASVTMNNVLSSATATPFTPFGRVLQELTLFDVSGPPIEIPNQVIARENGVLSTQASNTFFRSPFWLRRTVPAGVNPGEAVFALRCTSEQLSNGTPLNDFNKLNSGSLIVWKIDPPASRVSVSVPDRLLYAGGGARIVTTLKDGNGNPLENRSVQVTAAVGTITQDHSKLTDSKGEISTIYSVGSSAGGSTETFTATLQIDPSE